MFLVKACEPRECLANRSLCPGVANVLHLHNDLASQQVEVRPFFLAVPLRDFFTAETRQPRSRRQRTGFENRTPF